MRQAVFEVSVLFPFEHSFENTTRSSGLRSDTITGQLSANVATTAEDVEKLRPAWRSWSNSLDTEIDYFLNSLKSDPAVLRPYVITVYEDGVVQAILVGRVRKCRLCSHVSVVRIPGPKVRVLEIVTGGRLGRQSPSIDKRLAAELRKAIDCGDIEVINLQRLSLHSELFRELGQFTGFLAKARVPQVFRYSVLPFTTIGDNPPSIFSAKARREVRRKTRLLQAAFPGKVQFKCFSQPGELDAGIREAMSVFTTTWQCFFGSSLLDRPQTHEQFNFCASQGWLRTYIIYVENRPCAFLIGQLYNNTFYCHHAGYRRDFARHSVGSLLTAWAFEEMAAEGIERVDLGEGGQEHNRRLGCQIHEEATVHMYSRTLRGIGVNFLFAVTDAFRGGGRRCLRVLRLNRVAGTLPQHLISQLFHVRILARVFRSNSRRHGGLPQGNLR